MQVHSDLFEIVLLPFLLSHLVPQYSFKLSSVALLLSHFLCSVFKVRLRIHFHVPSKLNNVRNFQMRSDLRNSARFGYRTCLLRKEVIQPLVLQRLPCYDFTPIIKPTFGSALLAVRLLTSGVPDSHGVTGGVYKARERIHRGMLIRDY